MKNWYTDLDAAPGRRAPNGVLFAEDFGRPVRATGATDHPPEPEIIEPSFSADEMTEARARAFDEGHAAGLAAAAAAEAEAAVRMLDAIAAGLNTATQAGRDLAEARAQAIATLLTDALAAALPALCTRHGAAEIQAIVAAVLPGLAQEPAIEIAVAEDDVPAAQRAVARLDPGLARRVRLGPGTRQAPGDIRIAWKDGMATRDGAALCATVLEILTQDALASTHASRAQPVADRVMQAPGRHAPPPSGQPAGRSQILESVHGE